MKIYSVGQINNYIKNIIAQDYVLRNLTIRGEVSNCKYHSLGHIYFSLKDETGSMPAVMFKGSVANGLSFRMQDGQSVIVSGSIGVYERDGRYQMYATKITLDGAGKLNEEFERLKYKLNEEGLFDFEHKKPIPKFPTAVGIVTASTGAAIQDIRNIARRRNPYVQLILYPAKVQGEGAASTIARGIEVLDGMGLDTIIVGRGGGSMEDLWAFNEEEVVRAIFNAKTPIISGTGHEVDITLADYAADLRAPTPSAAAELAIPDVMTAVNQLETLANSLNRNMSNALSMKKLILENLSEKLEHLSPEAILKDRQQYLADQFDRLQRGMDKKLDEMKHNLELYTVKLHGLSPSAKLINGFGYIEIGDSPFTSVKEVENGDLLSITISDGTVYATVDNTVMTENV